MIQKDDAFQKELVELWAATYFYKIKPFSVDPINIFFRVTLHKSLLQIVHHFS